MTDSDSPSDAEPRSHPAGAPGSEPLPEPQIADVPIRGRYEAIVDGALAGWVEYRRMGRRLVAVHTEVLPAFGGHGIAARLVRWVIADAREAGTRISPMCPLFQAHFERHPEDRDVLAPGRIPG
jgi:predicted GNAT family acetyltransferase